MKKKQYIITFFLLLVFFVLLIFIINVTINKNRNNICDLNNTNKQAALVLGARVWANGKMSDIFRDRVETGLRLYNQNKVQKILISGDHGRKDYDEVNAAKLYLLERGVLAEDIFLDHAGFDTYDSLYRAKNIFKVTSLIVVTQNFHLPRALYIAKKIKIDACGVSADLHNYIGEKKRNRREVLANIKAWLDILVDSSPTYLGGVINITGDGQKSWD